MALKQFYATKDEIPTEQQSFYKPHNGRYELDIEGVNSVPGLLAKKTELDGKVGAHASELQAKDAEIANLKRAQADATTLPAGHVAVPKADAKYVELKSLGSPDEIKTKITEHSTLAEEKESRTKRDAYNGAAEVSGYNQDAFTRLAEKNGLPIPEVREVTEGGKKVKKAFVTVSENNKNVEKPLTDVVESSDDFKPFLTALKTNGSQGGTRMVHQDAGGKPATGNVYQKIRDDAESRDKAKKETAIPLTERKGLTVVGAA